jgi:tumor protein p53-inducible protein 3
MKAIWFDEPGGPDVMQLAERPDPKPGPGELLVRVRAAGVNRADVLQRMGRYPPPPGASPVLGLELAGEVAATGPDTTRFKPGDRVMSLVTGGAYATLAAVSEAATLPVPDTMDWSAAAAIPEAFLTAWLNLVDLGGLAAGETVLIHAGASGVGSAAIQIARELDARIITTAGTEDKLAFCRELGAALAVHRKQKDFLEAAHRDTGGQGVDLILDFVGAPYWERNLAALRRGGRLVLIGFLGGSSGDLDIGPILRKSLTVRGTTLRATAPAAKARLVRDFAAFAAPRFAAGGLRALVDRTFPLAQAAEAHRFMEADRNTGKIVLTVGDV